MTNEPSNPLHLIIDLLIRYYRAIDQVHHARTVQGWKDALAEWREIHGTIWAESPSNRNDTIRRYADPAKAWLGRIRSPYVEMAHLDLVEECVHVLSGFAVSPSPMAMPEIYSKTYSSESELWGRWEKQCDMLNALNHLIAKLKELSARAGEPWVETSGRTRSERSTNSSPPKQEYTELRNELGQIRFPTTPAGHVAFLEFVRDEVRNAAEAKRRQVDLGYSNATLESVVKDIKWTEARARLAALSTLPEGVRINLDDILKLELTLGTVEQIDDWIKPAVRGLRDWLELERLEERANSLVVIATAGDLWKAFSEGKRPCTQTSGISVRPGRNVPTITYTEDAAEAMRIALDHAIALVTAEGGEKAMAMEKLIARVQLRSGMDKANVINLPLTSFVAAAMGNVSASLTKDAEPIVSRPAQKASEMIKVLLLSANPIDSPLNIDEEFRAIDLKVRGSEHRDRVEFIKHGAVRLEDVAGLLMRHKPHIVHFSGHGATHGIALTGADAKARLIPPDALANIFKTLKDNVRVVLLNACDSALQAEALVKVIDGAVGMSDEIDDDAAIAFAAAFYEALAYGRSVQDAFDLALIQLEGAGQDRSLAKLYKRRGVKPSDIVLLNPAIT